MFNFITKHVHNKDFVKEFATVIKSFNDGQYTNESIMEKYAHDVILQKIYFSLDGNRSLSICGTIEKPNIHFNVTRDSIEFWLKYDEKSNEQFRFYIHKGKIKQKNEWDFIVELPESNLTVVLGFKP